MEKSLYALLAGVFAAGGSLFGKLSGLPAFEHFFLVRILFFIFMLLSNAFVWTFFVKALHQTDSTLSATVISAASNYFLSALGGYVIFGETTSLLWWSGMTFILFGLLLITKDEYTTRVGKKHDLIK